jgi:YHS domain-containing protein
MTFIARLLRFLFWVALVSWMVSLLRRRMNQMGVRQEQRSRDIDSPRDWFAGRLVRDPVCGMHVVASLALSVQQAGETVHFCSTACRDKYLQVTRGFAANA